MYLQIQSLSVGMHNAGWSKMTGACALPENRRPQTGVEVPAGGGRQNATEGGPRELSFPVCR